MDAQSGAPPREHEECLSCRLIGSASLGAVGAYALHQSRAHQPGSRVAKRVMAAVGISFLVASYVRWNASHFRERLR